MAQRPTLETTRLVLRPFALDDAGDVQRLAGAPEVADTTLNIPPPLRGWHGRGVDRHASGAF
jgi:[ribosomal protein S5]-alanine N-acetyltransferase